MNYATCVIYKIKCKDETRTDLYVGHTFNLYMRTAQHKSNCNNIKSKLYNIKLYQVIRANGGFDNWMAEVIEKYIECNSLEDARKRERYYIEQLNVNLNCNNPFRATDEKQKQLKELNKNIRTI